MVDPKAPLLGNSKPVVPLDVTTLSDAIKAHNTSSKLGKKLVRTVSKPHLGDSKHAGKMDASDSARTMENCSQVIESAQTVMKATVVSGFGDANPIVVIDDATSPPSVEHSRDAAPLSQKVDQDKASLPRKRKTPPTRCCLNTERPWKVSCRLSLSSITANISQQ